jgi:hypothetical protein
MGVVDIRHLAEVVRILNPIIRVGLPAAVVGTGIGLRAMFKIGLKIFVELEEAALQPKVVVKIVLGAERLSPKGFAFLG